MPYGPLYVAVIVKADPPDTARRALHPVPRCARPARPVGQAAFQRLFAVPGRKVGRPCSGNYTPRSNRWYLGREESLPPEARLVRDAMRQLLLAVVAALLVAGRVAAQPTV